jgi:uncharacterized protein (DUF305 family)
MTMPPLLLFVLLVGAGLLSGCSSDPAEKAPAITASTVAPAPRPAPPQQGLVEAVQLALHRLDTLKLSGNRDQDFAAILAIHHRAALRLARLELERGQDSVLLAIARQVRAGQPQQLQQLRLATARLDNPARDYNPRNGKDAFVRRSAAAMDTLLQPIGALQGHPDQDFATLLLAHHRAVTELAKSELALGRDAGMKQLARGIAAAQAQQVEKLRRWQAAHSAVGH